MLAHVTPRRLAALALCALLGLAGRSSYLPANAGHGGTQRAGVGAAPADATAPDGAYANGTVLPDGRLVTPIGTLHDLGDFPIGLALSPDGRLAVASNSGQGYGLNPGFNSYCTAHGQGNAPCPYHNPAMPNPARGAGNPATPAPDQSLSVIDLAGGPTREVTVVGTNHNPARFGAPGTYNYFYEGLAFSPDGRHLYAAGGGNDAVYDFPVAGGVVGPRPLHTVTLPSGVLSLLSAGFTSGLAITPDGRTLLVTQQLANTVSLIDTRSYAVRQVALGLPLLGGQYPNGVVVSPDGRTAYVAEQGAGAVAAIDLATARVRARIAAGSHATALALSPDGSQLYVACANDDTLAVIDTRAAVRVARIPLHALPGERAGSTPDAVAVSPDGGRIYVALAGDDTVAVIGTAASLAAAPSNMPGSPPNPAALGVGGFIPTGWYPSALAVSRAGDTLYVASAKGLGSRYPDGTPAIRNTYEYDGNNMPGLLQRVSLAGLDLGAGTAQVQDDLRFASATLRSPHNPIPAVSGSAGPITATIPLTTTGSIAATGSLTSTGGITPSTSITPTGPLSTTSPITHVLLIVRENRTFDQVLGDAGLDEGRSRAGLDGDPADTIFGRLTTPNAHALVGDPLPGHPDPAYATSDNFYSDGEASIQGHYWTSSANVSDYVEKSWLQYYSPRHHLQDPISSIGEPAGCSLFQAALARQKVQPGFSFRDYGEVTGVANAGLITGGTGIPGNLSPGVPERCAPVPTGDVTFAGGSNFNLDADNRVAARSFLADIGLDANGRPVPGSHGALRNFSYLLMSGDHTGGLAFADTPRSRVAQNDAGVGLIVQALSRSTYWPSTAIFVMEDDSQDGLDHRDGHRNLLYVVSPYARHAGADGKPGYVGHVHYDQASVLRTIELICGFPPLSTYDQSARPLYDLFQDKGGAAQLTARDLAPYSVQPAPPYIDEPSAAYKTGAKAASAAAVESRGLDMSGPDVAGPMLEIVDWQLAHPDRPVPRALIREERQWRSSASASRDQG